VQFEEKIVKSDKGALIVDGKLVLRSAGCYGNNYCAMPYQATGGAVPMVMEHQRHFLDRPRVEVLTYLNNEANGCWE
jgi:hypothetical protein